MIPSALVDLSKVEAALRRGLLASFVSGLFGLQIMFSGFPDFRIPWVVTYEPSFWALLSSRCLSYEVGRAVGRPVLSRRPSSSVVVVVGRSQGVRVPSSSSPSSSCLLGSSSGQGRVRSAKRHCGGNLRTMAEVSSRTIM